MKIVVVGLGYVGISNALLLSQHSEVVCLDISREKIEMLNSRRSPIDDEDARKMLKNESLNLRATLDEFDAYCDASYVLVATPTNFDSSTNMFDTTAVEGVVERACSINPEAVIIIKSTVPIGFTDSLREKLQTDRIIFSPEFLREGKAVYDNLYPSRIVIGEDSARAVNFVRLLKRVISDRDIPTLFTNNSEAEAIKLFSNAYLAMRVAFFNEIDTFSIEKKLNVADVIEGVCLDPRVGLKYNNPSFGFGGYCLPKDTKQLRSSFGNTPQNLITAISESNRTRKLFIAEFILANKPDVVGVYRLVMKKSSDNFRESSVLDVIEELKKRGLEVIIFEPKLKERDCLFGRLINDLASFKQKADVIIANRYEGELADVAEKVFTRDLFESDS